MANWWHGLHEEAEAIIIDAFFAHTSCTPALAEAPACKTRTTTRLKRFGASDFEILVRHCVSGEPLRMREELCRQTNNRTNLCVFCFLQQPYIPDSLMPCHMMNISYMDAVGKKELALEVDSSSVGQSLQTAHFADRAREVAALAANLDNT